MSFLEESRAFLDKYLGRTNSTEQPPTVPDDDCTSGATSGEEVWGTPTSGDNEEMLMCNSDNTQSVGFFLII